MTRASRRLTALLLLAMAAGPMACEDDGPARNAAGYEVAAVTIKGHTWQVEIADTDEKQILGLGQRDHLDEWAGMLFVYDEPDYRSFWMQGASIPLDIAFIDADGVIVRIHTMTVEPGRVGDRHYFSGAPALYALEVAAGTFERLGIVRGDQVELPQTVLDHAGGR